MLSSTLRFTPIIACLCRVVAGYTLTEDYSGDYFFSNFEAFSEEDPTQGFVAFSDYESMTTSGLIGSVINYNNASFMTVDSHQQTTSGRPSVRVTSQKSFNHGLFLADIAHMPGSICGVWPAYWMVGPDWPINGEIDIIEGVHEQTSNRMTLHTGSGCTITKDGGSSTINTTNCDVNAPDQLKNAGCGMTSNDVKSYGSGFNAVGGGVYATEWNSSAITIWFWPRSSIPSDIAKGQPDPTSWGIPMAIFSGSCDIDQHFKDLRIVFDTTFCGVWAGQVWNQSTCQMKASSCEAYVGQNPSAFKEAYWLVNSVRVYQRS